MGESLKARVDSSCRREALSSRAMDSASALARRLNLLFQTTGDQPMTQILALTITRQRVALLALLSFLAMC